MITGLCLVAALLCSARVLSMVLDARAVTNGEGWHVWQAICAAAGTPAQFPIKHYAALAAFFWVAFVTLLSIGG